MLDSDKLLHIVGMILVRSEDAPFGTNYFFIFIVNVHTVKFSALCPESSEQN